MGSGILPDPNIFFGELLLQGVIVFLIFGKVQCLWLRWYSFQWIVLETATFAVTFHQFLFLGTVDVYTDLKTVGAVTTGGFYLFTKHFHLCIDLRDVFLYYTRIGERMLLCFFGFAKNKRNISQHIPPQLPKQVMADNASPREVTAA